MTIENINIETVTVTEMAKIVNKNFSNIDASLLDKVNKVTKTQVDNVITLHFKNGDTDLFTLDFVATDVLNTLESTEVYKALSANQGRILKELILGKLDRDGIINIPNLGQDVKEAMTGGSVAVVGENSVLNKNIVDGQVFGYKTDFMLVNEYSNLLDRRNIKQDFMINGGVDGTEKPQSGFFVTDYIKVRPNSKYYYGNLYGGYYAFYDINKRYISGLGVADNITELPSPFVTPLNAYYMRMTSNKLSNRDTCWVSRSSSKVDEVGYLMKDTVLFDDSIMNRVRDFVYQFILDHYMVPEDRTTFLSEIGETNPIKKDRIKENTYILGAVDGSEKSAKGLYATDYCLVSGSTKYYYNDLYEGHYAFYDENKRFISGSGIAPSDTDLRNPFTTPPNAKYARFTIAKSSQLDTCWINTKNETPSEKIEYVLGENIYTSREKEEVIPVNYDGYEISTFNKIACIGDSLTEGVFNASTGEYITDKKYSYPTYLSKLTGVTTVNLGKGGYTSKRWWDEMQSQSLSGYDLAIIQLGVNDVAMSDQNITPDLTKEYIQNIIDKLKRENKGIKIFVAGITKSRWYSGTDYLERDRVIKEFASNRESEGIYFIDLQKYSKNSDRPYASGHLTALGYMQQALEYKNYISYLISRDIDRFIGVQFIGSDKQPI